MRTTMSTGGSSVSTILLYGIPALLVGGAGVVGTLFALGVDMKFWEKKPAPAAADRSLEGLVPVPVAGQPIPAYSKVNRDHLADPATKGLAVLNMHPNDIPKEAIRDLSKILGRVLKNDKKPGYVFTERDFYPPGTQAGITAGIPPGKRSFVFEAEKVYGMASLRQGDHFDIISALVEEKRPGNSPLFAPGGATPPKRARVRPLVQSGVVLTPATIRQVPVTTTALAPGAQPKSKPVQEITIAVDPDEVGPLAESLALHATLTCVARSGQPSDLPDTDVTVGQSAPDVRVTYIETIVDGKVAMKQFVEPVLPFVPAKPEPAPAPRPVDRMPFPHVKK